MQSHTNSVFPHNNIDNESFARQTTSEGPATDRPTQPESWRSPETLQEGKKH